MNIRSTAATVPTDRYVSTPASPQESLDRLAQRDRQLPDQPETDELRERFEQFVGQTLFGSMMASMRKSVGKPAYMHGGQTEEIFQSQMDQHIVEDLSKASADTVAGPMYDLFMMGRS